MSISYSLVVDRPLSIFDAYVSYSIAGYNDPETGEYFGDTSWNLSTYKITGEFLGGLGGFASEGDTISFGLFSPGSASTLQAFTFNFTAQNTFSAVSDTLIWNAYIAAESTKDEIIVGSSKSDIIISGSGADIIQAKGGSDTIFAGDGNDLIDAGEGADLIDGEGGADVMAGGLGDDTYYFDTHLDIASERPGEGNDTIISTVNATLPMHVERLVLSGAMALVGTGSTQADRIEGNEFNNTLLGLDGHDRLFGFGGTDLLVGGSGQDTLDGGAGTDTMEGGTGADTYIVDSQKDRVIDTTDPDRDLVIVSGLSVYTLTANIEDLTTSKTTNFRGIGNELANKITGNKGHDTLEGLDGADALYGDDGNDILIGGKGGDFLSGGAGNDTASYATSTDAVQINLGTSSFKGGDAAGDGMLGIENVIGTNGNDILGGNAIANRLWGGNGNDQVNGAGGDDLIFGGAGADTLNGGGGIDMLSYAGSTAGGVTVDLELQLGTALGGDAQGDELSNFENVTGSEGDDTILGDAKDNTLIGRAGNDVLNGRGGRNILMGGAGADTLIGGFGGDTASYAQDTVGVVVQLSTGFAVGGEAEGDVLTSIESVIGGSGNDELVGDSQSNVLTGGAGDDTINGGEGDDTVSGGMGADSMDGGDGVDLLSYAGSSVGVGVQMNLGNGTGYLGDGAGDTFINFENVLGSSHGDFIQGDQHANRLMGGGGSDVLDGGGGNDRLTGGDGDDVFRYLAGGWHDTIIDFDMRFGSLESIELTMGAAFDTFAEVLAAASSFGASGQHTVISFSSTETLTLLNVSKASLTADKFQFAI